MCTFWFTISGRNNTNTEGRQAIYHWGNILCHIGQISGTQVCTFPKSFTAIEAIEELEDIQVIEVDRSEANAVIARRHQEATDAGYESARKKLKIWLSTHHPRALTGNNGDPINARDIILPLDRDITLSFLGQAQRLRLRGHQLEEKPGDQPPIAVSTMTAIGSAISDLYKSQNISMSEDLKSEMNKFDMKGYRTINLLKQRGNSSPNNLIIWISNRQLYRRNGCI